MKKIYGHALIHKFNTEYDELQLALRWMDNQHREAVECRPTGFEGHNTWADWPYRAFMLINMGVQT